METEQGDGNGGQPKAEEHDMFLFNAPVLKEMLNVQAGGAT